MRCRCRQPSSGRDAPEKPTCNIMSLLCFVPNRMDVNVGEKRRDSRCTCTVGV